MMTIDTDMVDPQIKKEVRQFYNQIGWQEVSQGLYQNARYEDLRTVSHPYIHRCHLRVLRHIRPEGRLLLDAGSGPIQYPEYLEYSKGYRHRVCIDISVVALKEARQRIGKHGLFVVADIANLPFKEQVFEGAVSLHTIHHLPQEEHINAYRQLFRVLARESSAVVVNGWPSSRLMKLFNPLVRAGFKVRWLLKRLTGRTNGSRKSKMAGRKKDPQSKQTQKSKGTYTSRHDVEWMRDKVGTSMPLEIFVWRSVNVRFLRALMHNWLGGRLWLFILYWLEEFFPHFFGEIGQYPLIVINKS